MKNKSVWALVFIPGIVVGIALLLATAFYTPLPKSAPTPPAPAADPGPAPSSASALALQAATPSGDPAWSADKLWDDGLAEVAHYTARRIQYEKPRTFDAVLITVKEDFNKAFYVKADPPYESKSLLPVLKLNVITKYDTENYPYSYLTSVFVERGNPFRLVKLTNGSQEWCGNTFKELKTWGGKTGLEYRSYFDGQGDGSTSLDWYDGDLAEDQLPVSLRALRFAPGLELKTRLLPSAITNSARKVEMVPAAIRVEGAERVAGLEAWRVKVSAGDLKQTYWFEKAAPHILVKFTSSDGRELALKSRKRWAYWKRS